MARVDNAGNAYWTLTDRQGSVRDVIDNSGNVKDAINYDAFGNIISETNSVYRGSYAWTGRELDVETDLQYNRARWYDPATSRWMSQDPLGFDAGDSNLYRYVNNQPPDATDPSGLSSSIDEQINTCNLQKIRLNDAWAYAFDYPKRVNIPDFPIFHTPLRLGGTAFIHVFGAVVGGYAPNFGDPVAAGGFATVTGGGEVHLVAGFGGRLLHILGEAFQFSGGVALQAKGAFLGAGLAIANKDGATVIATAIGYLQLSASIGAHVSIRGKPIGGGLRASVTWPVYMKTPFVATFSNANYEFGRNTVQRPIMTPVAWPTFAVGSPLGRFIAWFGTGKQYHELNLLQPKAKWS